MIRQLVNKVKLILCKNDVFYINSNESLPPPLTKEEEQNLYNEISQGKESSKNKLIVHNLRLVVYIAKKFENSGVPIDDLISIGTIGLIKAVNTFSPERSIKLATYASRCIENEILMYLRKTSNMKNEVSIEELLLCDILGSEADIVNKDIEQELEKKLLLQAVDKLNSREKLIMEMRFGLNSKKEFTQKQVADELGISQSYISRLEKKIIKRLRNDLKKVV